jgi:glycosyltransferase involved in cell wall biosynthesis
VKIAIIASSPTPYKNGEADNIWRGLADAIGKYTSHQCELIKVPIKEDSFWSLIDAYHLFYRLDLSHFDMVISGKYPAWMVQHSNHQVYMIQCLRRLYDTYTLPKEYSADNNVVRLLISELRTKNVSPSRIFNLLNAIRNDDSIPAELFGLPGAFAREIIHTLDQWSLKRVRRISAISKTVAERTEYFPPSYKVGVIYPPSALSMLHNSGMKYFFTASRLDEPKRIRMILEAYLKTTTKIPLKIAGSGPLENELRELASKDKRVEFLGYVSDLNLVEYYASAYAIIFVPKDEGYGLITIEAMKSRKPVITFSDSGGVAEFVEHEKTGLVSEPIVSLLAENISILAMSSDLCQKMGRAALKKVEQITWRNTVRELLKNTNGKASLPGQLNKITVVSSYSFYPPRGGGQNRIFYLYKEIAKKIRVEIVCLVDGSQQYGSLEVAPNLIQIKIPKSYEHGTAELEMKQDAGISITDIALISLYEKTPLLIEALRESLSTSDLVICSHPFVFPLVEEFSTIPIVHESHNVEFLLKKEMLLGTVGNKELMAALQKAEKRACLESVLTTVCAEADGKKFQDLYGYDSASSLEVPNGVDLASVTYLSSKERNELKVELGIESSKIAIFIGSWHQPNINAIVEISKLAKRLDEYYFLIVGNAANYFKDIKLPNNIKLIGFVTDEEKQLYLNVSDVALNPMLEGSGTNLKMLDYMASGVPVVTTKIGARGLNIPEGLLVVSSIDDFERAISKVAPKIDTLLASEFVRANFDWKNIADKYFKVLKELFDAD